MTLTDTDIDEALNLIDADALLRLLAQAIQRLRAELREARP
jgi:hypothetical protein